MKKDKARDVARGVLPSTARRKAREDKRDFHHTHRHAQRQINHEIVRSTTVVDDDGNLYTDPDLFDDFEPRHVIDGYVAKTKKDGAGWDCDMQHIVSERRGADNLGPLLSWARATERQKMVGWSVFDKHAYFKAVLPDSLQGRHALGHVEQALDLSVDEYSQFWRYYRRPAPVTKEQFRAALNRLLSTNQGHAALRAFILDTVPVAAHRTETNNKKRSRAEARDENGEIRYVDTVRYEPRLGRLVIGAKTPMMVDVYIPQIVVTTCEECSFVRNDPLATTFAVNTFVDLVWSSNWTDRFGRFVTPQDNPHVSFHKVRQFIIDSAGD
jgi:hypothetical protein